MNCFNPASMLARSAPTAAPNARAAQRIGHIVSTGQLEITDRQQQRAPASQVLVAVTNTQAEITGIRLAQGKTGDAGTGLQQRCQTRIVAIDNRLPAGRQNPPFGSHVTGVVTMTVEMIW